MVQCGIAIFVLPPPLREEEEEEEEEVTLCEGTRALRLTREEGICCGSLTLLLLDGALPEAGLLLLLLVV
jgi:hypothetical protein